MSSANEIARRELARAQERVASRQAAYKRAAANAMTVSELIASLQSMDPDLPVVFMGESDYASSVSEVIKTTVPKTFDQTLGEYVDDPQEVAEIRVVREAGWAY